MKLRLAGIPNVYIHSTAAQGAARTPINDCRLIHGEMTSPPTVLVRPIAHRCLPSQRGFTLGGKLRCANKNRLPTQCIMFKAF